MYKVQYTVDGYENVFYSDSYDSYDLATEHCKDIAGYEGVHDAEVIPSEK